MQIKNNTEMRQLNISLIFLLVSVSIFGQSENWKQKNARINFAITPQAEYLKIGGKFSPSASLAGSIAFNNTFFLGGYFAKKPLRQYVSNPLDPTSQIDVNYQHMGIEFLYAMRLALYRTEGGHYVHPKLRIIVGGRFGGGTFWIDNQNKEKISSREYFYYIQPQVGVAYPINDYVTAHAGFCYSAALSVDKLSNYYKGADFSGPGVYLGAKISIFR
jgi:hypothetical protein